MLFSLSTSSLLRRLLSSDFIRKVGETFAARLVLIAIGFVTTVVVARILGPEGRGLYAVAVAVGAIGVQFGNLGLPSSNTYSVSRDRLLLAQLTGNALVIGIGLGACAALAAWVVFSIWPALAPVQGWLLVLALAWVPFGLTYLLQQNLLIGINEVRAYNLIDIAINGLALLMTVMLIAAGRVIPEYVMLIGVLTVAIGVCLTYLRIRPHLQGVLRPSFALFNTTARYGFKAYLACLFAYVLLKSNIVIVQYMLGAEQAGYFSIASALADVVYMLPVVVGIILFPRLAAMQNEDERYHLCVRTASVLGILMAGIALVVGLLAEPLVRILFGEAYVPATPAFLWLLPAIVILSVNTVYMNYFAAIGMPLVAVYSPAVSLVVGIVFSVVLIVPLGLIGVSIASGIAYSLMLGFSLVYVAASRRHRNAN